MPVPPTGRFTNHVVAVLGLAAVATEAVSVRDHRAPGPSAAAAVTVALGVIINGLGRTDGPLCRPESVLQGHPAWHMLSGRLTRGLGAGTLLPPA